MTDALFLDTESLAVIVELLGQFVGYGLCLAMIVWVLGYVVWFIVDTMRVV